MARDNGLDAQLRTSRQGGTQFLCAFGGFVFFINPVCITWQRLER